MAEPIQGKFLFSTNDKLFNFFVSFRVETKIQRNMIRYDTIRYNVCNPTGYLTRIELQKTIEEATFQEFDMNHIEILYQEFDKDENGKIDFPEFKVMVKYIKGNKKKKERSSSVSSVYT